MTPATLQTAPMPGASEQQPQSPFALEYERVTFSYGKGPGAKKALENISLRVPAGERLGIFGPNGGGKTTLLKLTLGLLGGHSGRIAVFGRTPARAREEGLIGYVPQRVEAELAFPLSVRQVVAMGVERGLPPWAGLPKDRAERAERTLALVGAAEIADRPIGRLSGGQLQRVMIARALAAEPRILLLDEPTVGIDVAGQQRFAELMVQLHRELNLTLVVVSHDLRAIAAGCDRIAVLSRTLHSHVAPQGLTPQLLAEVFSHDVASVLGDVHVHAHLADECDAPAQDPCGHGCAAHEHAEERPSGGVQDPPVP